MAVKGGRGRPHPGPHRRGLQSDVDGSVADSQCCASDVGEYSATVFDYKLRAIFGLSIWLPVWDLDGTKMGQSIELGFT